MNHEGTLLREHLKAKRIWQKDFAPKVGLANRAGLVHYLKMEKLPAAFKDKLHKAGVLIFVEAYRENVNYRELYEKEKEENARLNKEIVRLQADLIIELRKR